MCVPSRRVYLMRAPSLAPSLAAKVGGGRGHHAVHGREAREVLSRGREIKTSRDSAGLRLTRPSLVTLLSVSWGYPSYVP
jgi:hypothetical protein